MRSVSGGLISFLQAGQGIESVLGVSFGLGIKWYADKSIGNIYTGVEGRIIQCSPIESILKLSGGGGSGQVTVVLDNTDNTWDYKNLLNLVFTKVTFKQFFYSTNLDGSKVQRGSVEVYRGHISTPISWDEVNRTVTFTISQSIKSREAGYCIENLGNFPKADVIAHLGQPLPMIFGHVYHSPCVKITQIPSIWTTEGFGLVDKTIDKQIAKLRSQLMNTVLYGDIDMADASLAQQNDELKSLQEQAQQIIEHNDKIMQDIHDLEHERSNQMQLAGSGRVPLQLNMKFAKGPGDCQVRIDNMIFNARIPAGSLTGSMDRHTVKGPGETFQQWIAEGFKWVRAGSRVQLLTPYEVWYIASTTPGAVLKVWAYRSIGGQRMLTPVPKEWYSIKTIGVATCVVLNMPLSSRDWILEQRRIYFENVWGKYLPIHINQPFDWEDELYVEFAGEIGPEPMGIMSWLIETFDSDYTIEADPDSSPDDINKYKMHFMISVKEDCIKLIQDICYQCNCSLYLKNDTELFVRYWPKGMRMGPTITHDDMEYGSLQIMTSNIDEIYTRSISTCRLDYSPNFDKPITLRATYNADKYGIITESRDYFCYTTPAYAENVALYWLALNSQPYTKIVFRAMAWHIGIEAFDYISTPYGTAVVESAQYDSENNVNLITANIYPTLDLGSMDKDTYWPDYVNVEPGQGGEPAGGELMKLAEQTGGIKYNIEWPDEQGTASPPKYAPPPDEGGEDDGWPMYVPDGPVPEFIPDVPPLGGDYTYNDYPPIELPELLAFSIAPCVIKSSSERGDYTVTAYPSGLDGEGKNVTAKQLQIAKDDAIPEGSWGFVVGVRNKETKSVKYYIQYPIWLG